MEHGFYSDEINPKELQEKMATSIHLIGFAEPDERWLKMKAAYEACKAAGVAIPGEVMQFFDDEAPDEAGTLVGLESVAREWVRGSCAGYEVLVEEIPPTIKKLRFYVTW